MALKQSILLTFVGAMLHAQTIDSATFGAMEARALGPAVTSGASDYRCAPVRDLRRFGFEHPLSMTGTIDLTQSMRRPRWKEACDCTIAFPG